MSEVDPCSIVIDNGAGCCKAGFSAEDSPRSIFPTVVGRFRTPGLLDAVPDILCGAEAYTKQGLLKLVRPIEGGIIENWDDMEKIWHHVFFRELHVAPEASRVVHTIPPLVPLRGKEMIAEIMFESFNVAAMYECVSSVLALYASGLTTGVVWEAGATSAHSVPIYEGYAMRHAVVPSVLHGGALTGVAQTLLGKRGYCFTTPRERDIVADIKAKLCYVADDYDVEVNTAATINKLDAKYTLPDGQEITIGSERFDCPEVLFQPSLHGIESPSIADTISLSIIKCDIDFQPLLFSNIVLAGGSTMFPGLAERLKKEIVVRTKKFANVIPNVIAPPARLYAAWVGGSILSALSTFQHCWVTKEQYEDVGSKIVHRKCF